MLAQEYGAKASASGWLPKVEKHKDCIIATAALPQRRPLADLPTERTASVFWDAQLLGEVGLCV